MLRKMIGIILLLIVSFNSFSKEGLESIGIPFTQDNYFSKGVYKDDLKVIKLFLDAGIDIETTDDKGYTALQTAAYYGSSRTIKMLVNDYSADVNRKNNGEDSLAIFLRKNISDFPLIKEVVPILIKNGATMDIYNSLNKNSFILKTYLGYYRKKPMNQEELNLIEFMFNHGYDINSEAVNNNQASFLSMAAYSTDLKLMNLILNYDVDVAKKDRDGMTALHYLYEYYNNGINKCFGDCSEHYKKEELALIDRNDLFRKVVRKIVLRGGSFASQNNNGETPLGVMNAVSLVNNWVEVVVGTALEYGANIDEANKEGEYALYKVLYKRRDLDYIKPTISYLLRKGANPLLFVDFKFKGKAYNSIDAFCLNMNSLRWSERDTHPEICSPRNVDNFKKYYMGLL